MKPKLIVVGSMNMDLIVRASRLPAPGETVTGGEFHKAAGGKGANQAVAAARLGAQVYMVGRVGQDAYGNELREGLVENGVYARYVYSDSQAHTGVAVIVVDAQGENIIVVSPGANWRLSAMDVEKAADVIAGADMLLLQLEVSLAVIESAVELATRHAVPVMLNPAPAQELPTALMRRVAYLVPNAGEAALLSGIPVHDPDSARQAAAHLHEFGVERLVITLGDQGAYYSQESDGAHVPAYPVAPVDTTGAGDALLAGLAVGLTSGMGLAEAVRFGSAAGALATTRLGAQPSLPTRKEVEALFNPKD